MEFVEREIKLVHQQIINKLPAGAICNSCTTQNVVLCPTKDVCTIERSGKCRFHSVLPTSCPNKICDTIAKEIKSIHNYNTPSWRNTDASRWCTSAWELAKCFLPSDGYLTLMVLSV